MLREIPTRCYHFLLKSPLVVMDWSNQIHNVYLDFNIAWKLPVLPKKSQSQHQTMSTLFIQSDEKELGQTNIYFLFDRINGRSLSSLKKGINLHHLRVESLEQTRWFFVFVLCSVNTNFLPRLRQHISPR